MRSFDTCIRDVERIKVKLLNGLRPGAILLLHDGNGARTLEQQPAIISVLPALLLAAKEAGLHFVTLRHACTHHQTSGMAVSDCCQSTPITD